MEGRKSGVRRSKICAVWDAYINRGSLIPLNWVAVKELKLSYYIGKTLVFTIYTHYGNLI